MASYDFIKSNSILLQSSDKNLENITVDFTNLDPKSSLSSIRVRFEIMATCSNRNVVRKNPIKQRQASLIEYEILVAICFSDGKSVCISSHTAAQRSFTYNKNRSSYEC